MPLDSDIADADSHLFVEFYINERKDPVDGQGEKLTAWEGKPFVRIMNPGDKTSVFEQPATEQHMRRFPRHWLAFQMQQQGQEPMAPIGTPLQTWSEERPQELVGDQLRELVILGFRTVEQVANGSDHQMQRVGMGGIAVRERARAYLASRNAGAQAGELAETRRQLDEMREMMAKLVANASIQADPPRRGRPPKDVTHVDDNDAGTDPAGDGRAGDSHP